MLFTTVDAMTDQREHKPRQAGSVVFVRLGPGENYSGPIPTADRVRMHDPTGRSPYVELYWRDWLVGYAPSEDA